MPNEFWCLETNKLWSIVPKAFWGVESHSCYINICSTVWYSGRFLCGSWPWLHIILLLAGHVMAVISSGRVGDQVTLTSGLREFEEPVCITFDYRLDEPRPGAGGTLSVYLLSKQLLPIRLQLEELNPVSDGSWKSGCVYIPNGTYYVMFLATLGMPYYSNIYLDNIEVVHEILCHEHSIRPTGNIILFLI